MTLFTGNGIEICFEQSGGRTDPPVMLVHGIGCQLVQWPPSLIKGLLASGLRVIRMDNRDAGLSGKIPDTPGQPPYHLADMAGDVLALLDHLGLADTHVLGVSMGGMIAQHLAFSHAERVRSLTCIMSTSGDPSLPPPAQELTRAMLAPQPPGEDALARSTEIWNRLGGKHYLSAQHGIGQLAEIATRRMLCPEGLGRQLAAIIADGSRTERLTQIALPALIIHGAEDPLLPVQAGQHLAQVIPGARLEVMQQMGHDLPEPLMASLLQCLTDFIHQAQAGRST